MNKLLLAIVTKFSFMQVAVLNCEANCLSGHHGHSKEMSSDHSCCKSKKSVKKTCHSEFKSNDHHSCLHKLVDSSAVLEPSKVEITFKEFSIKAKLVYILNEKIDLTSNVLSIGHQPDRNYQKFKSLQTIYIHQRKFLI